MKKVILLVLGLSLLSLKIYTQNSLSVFIGPNISSINVNVIAPRNTFGELDFSGSAKSGFGLDAGFSADFGYKHLISFRMILGYSLQGANINLSLYNYRLKPAGIIPVVGNYYMSNVLFAPQLEFNIFKNSN